MNHNYSVHLHQYHTIHLSIRDHLNEDLSYLHVTGRSEVAWGREGAGGPLDVGSMEPATHRQAHTVTSKHLCYLVTYRSLQLHTI